MRKQILTSLALTSLMATLASAQSSTNEFSRAATWEVYGFGQAIVIYNVLESDANVFGGGLGGGYNFSDHFTLRGDFAISSVKFTIDPIFSGTEEDVSTTLYMGNISLDYNILKSRVTPVVSVGGGIGVFSDEGGTVYAANLGLGVRWDVNDRVFTRLMVSPLSLWESTSDHQGWWATGFSLSVGYKF
jgi:hypothetical protein